MHHRPKLGFADNEQSGRDVYIFSHSVLCRLGFQFFPMPFFVAGRLHFFPTPFFVAGGYFFIQQDMRSRESVSRGAGADAVGDSEGGDNEFKSSIHTWNFCGGKVPTMVYEDLMKAKCGGGDIGSGLADTVIPDGFAGSGTSVPGGTGTRSITQSAPSAPQAGGGRPTRPGAADAAHVRKKKAVKKTDQDEKGAAYGSFQKLMETMTRNEADEHADVQAGGIEELAEDVLRLGKRIRELPQDADADSRDTFDELLDDAKAKLKFARDQKRAKRAAGVVRV